MVKPGYKETEIGVIPKDWEVKPIRSFAQISMCKRIFAEQTSEKGEIPFYKIGTFGKEPDAYISKKLYSEYRRKFSFPQKGDILISAAGTLGRTVKYDGKDSYFQDSNIVWLDIDKQQICNEYLYQYYQVIRWASSEGSTISRLYNGIIYSTYIVLPSLEEQQKIAEALSDMDELIASLEKLIAKKKSIKQGTTQELLTGKKRLPGFNGEWNDTCLKGFVGFQVGFPFASQYFNSKGTGLRLIKNRDLKTDDQVYFTTEEANKEYIVKNGDILVGMDGDFLPCRWTKGISLLNQRVGRLFAKAPINLLFLYYALQKPLLELQSGTGATTVKHLSHKDIEKIHLQLPKLLEEQNAIASILSDMDAEIEALEQKLAKCHQIKQGMMQQLLTGKIRLI